LKNNPIKKSWVTGLDEELEKDIREAFKGSIVLRKRLGELVENKIDTNVTVTRSKANYDNPNWTYLQADSCGYQRALKEIIELIQ
jgi:hypothetical protein